jgi:hypothetical protein
MLYDPAFVFAPTFQVHDTLPLAFEVLGSNPAAVEAPLEYVTVIEYDVFGEP